MSDGIKAWYEDQEAAYEASQQEKFEKLVKKMGLVKLRSKLNGLYHDLAHLNTDQMRLTKQEHETLQDILKGLEDLLS